MRQYEGRGLIGEKYLLQNVSNAPWCWPNRSSIATGWRCRRRQYRQHNLRPGESTSVVIRRGEAP